MRGEGQRPRRRLAGALIALASLIVPRGRRGEWRAEWRGELDSLDRAECGLPPPQGGLPGPLEFALGSFPHALWTMKEEWTMDGVLQDLKYATRILRRSPGFTVVAAMTLALGIGANASIFSLVNGLILRSPPGIREPERLVQIARSYEDAPRWDNFSWPALNLIRREARSLSGVAGYQSQAFVLGRGLDVEQVVGELVTGDYFQVLGVQPFLGRLLQPSDDTEPGAHAVAVLSHAIWERRFGADSSVVGRTVSVGAVPYEIVGVAPRGFAGPETVGTPPALWVPATMSPGYRGELPFDQWGWSWINAIGRLREGVSFQEAQESMGVVAARLRDADPVNRGMEVLLEQGVGLDPQGREQARQLSLILFFVVGLVLILACSNVANLFLARAASRRTEVGVRMAMGAGRGRLARQLLTESLLLSVMATALAAPLVLAAGRFLPMVIPYGLTVSLAPDRKVFLFLLAVGIVAGILFGLAPAWATSPRHLTQALREGASAGGRVRSRLRDGLVVLQLSLSLALVAGAALLGRSVANAASARPGFDPKGLTAGFVDLEPTGRYDPESGTDLFERLLDAAYRIPGVGSATLASEVPIAGGHSRRTVRPVGRDDVGFEAEAVVVGPRYFETLGIPILRGRSLRGPGEETGPVVVVNQALAQRFWPGEDPVGQELQGAPNLRVVGLVGDVQMRSLRSRAIPAVYYPMAQHYVGAMAIQLRTSSGRGLPTSTLREAVSQVDPELPVSAVVDLRAALSSSMGETRTIGFLVGSFAVLALVLAVVGLYGLVSYGASQRVREMGIRIALGARPGSLVRLVLTRGAALSVLGVALGLAAAFGMGQALRGLLFGVQPTDVPTLGAAAVLLLASAGLAAWVPARRASRTDPAVSLREE